MNSSQKKIFAVKNSFEFSKEVCEQNPEYLMASLDVEFLFTNIPLEETIKISCDSLYESQEFLCNISKIMFEKLLRAALSNSYFLFDVVAYQQVDGVAMGSPLGTSLAHAFLAHYEQVWLNDFFFFSILVFFHEHSRMTGLQGKGEGISLTPHYHFHPLYRH